MTIKASNLRSYCSIKWFAVARILYGKYADAIHNDPLKEQEKIIRIAIRMWLHYSNAIIVLEA